MLTRSVVFMFSGLGSQYYQMGRAFFDGNATFRTTLLELDNLATPILGRSIVDVLYNDGRRKEELFDELPLTSAAIFLVEQALAKTLTESGIKADYLMASSMGTYAAATFASALDAREVLEVLVELPKIYQAQCRKGGMIAILGDRALHQKLRALRENSDIAAINYDSHFVISASDEHLDDITAALRHENVTFQKIAASYPFHSRWIDNARAAALETLGTLRYRRHTIPLVCCARTGLVEAVTPEQIWNALRQPIEFKRTIMTLEALGPHDYVDVGPAGTLATMLKYALPPASASRSFPILSPFGQDLKNYERLTLERNSSGNPSQDAHHQGLRDRGKALR